MGKRHPLGEIDGELLLYAGVLRLFPLGTQDLGWVRRTDTVPLTVLDDVITPKQGVEGIGCRCMPRYMQISHRAVFKIP